MTLTYHSTVNVFSALVGGNCKDCERSWTGKMTMHVDSRRPGEWELTLASAVATVVVRKLACTLTWDTSASTKTPCYRQAEASPTDTCQARCGVRRRSTTMDAEKTIREDTSRTDNSRPVTQAMVSARLY